MTDMIGVPRALAEALDARGYNELTPVQSAMLDPALAHADLLVSAQTGSGKTVAFGLAIGPNMLAEKNVLPRASAPRALVVAPTRELAIQVKRELDWLYAGAKARIVSCVGGMDMRTERAELAHGAHIVVGTPGRLVDHISRGSLNIAALEAVILDEADEMLDLGFRDDLETILAAAPEERRTLMFSATVSKPIAALAKHYQRDAVRVNTTTGEKQHGDIGYRALTVASYDRENAIINVLRYYEAPNALVFCGTRATVNHLTSRLNNRGFSVVALSGELSQKERTHALQMMRDGRARVCVATDVAARGIDLPGLDLVVHADLPKNTEALLHRSGRTGRAGKKGTSVLVVPVNSRRRVERLLMDAKVAADWAKPPSVEDVIKKDDERLLSDPALVETMTEDDKKMAEALIEKHGAENVAAAFVRLHRGKKSAPEELSETPAGFDRGSRSERNERPSRRNREERSSGPREEFAHSIWVSLSIGRSKKAEARWILPMLCKSGGLPKADIGAIRIQENETFVQVNATAADSFLKRVTESGPLEQGITVSKTEGMPAQAAHSKKPSAERKPYGGKKPYGEKKPYSERKSFGDKKPYSARVAEDDTPSFDDWSPTDDFGASKHKKQHASKKPYEGNKPAYGDKKTAYREKKPPYGAKKPYQRDGATSSSDGEFRRRPHAVSDNRPARTKPDAAPAFAGKFKPKGHPAKGKFVPGSRPKATISAKSKSKHKD